MVTENDYLKAKERLEELIDLVDDSTSENDPNFIELMKVSGIIEEFELEHFPIKMPTLIQTIEYIMYERKMTKTSLANILEIPVSRVSEYLNGKRDITLEVAKKLHKRLNIDSDIILQ